ncbi:TIGR02677 family protein [Actinocorallia libanotica]|uniref:TIGR02677 family protein n=1 Tax=Actinocorallia libanotica TaxID=46162 RepID=A0ABN1Q6A1_9ACTN
MAGLPRVPGEMFRFTTTEKSELHTAVLWVFGETGERMPAALTVEQVLERLRASGWYLALEAGELSGVLDGLAQWGLLDVVFNHSGHFATAEEYERKNLQYSLTRRGEAAFAGVQHALTVLSSSGALQTAVLNAIADRLNELGRLLNDADRSQDRRIFTALQELEGHLDALRTNTRGFNGELQRLMRVEGTDLATFHEVKRATVGYLQEFVTDLESRAGAIAQALETVDAHGVNTLHKRALAGAELPPVHGTDPAAAWLNARAVQWKRLRDWFAPEDDGTPHVMQLHDVARHAIVSLLQVLERITDSRRRSSSVAGDFRTLARRFATAPSEAEAHRLWAVAFGLGSAQHAHLGHEDAEAIPAGIPWGQAAPVRVSALLREKGKTERMGRPGRVRDVSAIRAARRARAEQERAELEAAWATLSTRGPVRLSSFGRLDQGTFGRLLELLGRALAERADASGVRCAVTSDGRTEIILYPPEDGATAVLHTAEGRLRGPDYAVDIRVSGRTAASA